MIRPATRLFPDALTIILENISIVNTYFHLFPVEFCRVLYLLFELSLTQHIVPAAAVPGSVPGPFASL